MATIYHEIDRAFFNDVDDMFKHPYTWYTEGEFSLDDLGRKITKYEVQEIWGSLQPQSSSLNQSVDGNTIQQKYLFYCKSKFRIKIGDYILHNGKFLLVDGISEYDAYGVRNASLTMTNLTDLKDLNESKECLSGERLV